jgi:DNA-binding Lrp family transcriptional regulator
MNILKESEVRTEGGGAAGAKRGEIVYGGTVTHEEIDELDEKILLALAADARARSKEIAAAVGVSLDTVRNRIRALKKKKILLGFRTVFSLKRIGLVYHDVVVELSHASFDVFKKIYAYCQERPEVCFVVRCIGDHELELEVATSSVEEFDEFTAQFRKAFAPDVREMESARIFHTAKINFYK